MECVKESFFNSFPHPKKAITYQPGSLSSPSASIFGAGATNSGIDATTSDGIQVDVAQLAYDQALNNYAGNTSYAGLCNKYIQDVYSDIGYSLSGNRLAADFGSYPELSLTTHPVPGDIVQFLVSNGAANNHVAMYVGDQSILTTTRSTSRTNGAIVIYTFDQFGAGLPAAYYHYTGVQ